jgi:23S rRNA (adenine2503-C2)-methyltransferase
LRNSGNGLHAACSPIFLCRPFVCFLSYLPSLAFIRLNLLIFATVTQLPNIRSLDLPALKAWLEGIGEKGFRAKQIHEWLWKRNADSFEAMTNLGQGLRQQLQSHFTIGKLSVHSEQRSNDGTIKYAFQLPDGNLVEGVLIPTETRVTACVSSQIGCSLTCKFCATGYLDLKRNLHHYEIFDQVAYIKAAAEREYGRPLTNIVYMGMGEPLLNYKQVLGSIEKITSEEGLGMAPKRITVSTAGIAKMIRKLGDDDVRFEFALSLHAGNDAKRNEIMPINESNSLEALGEALKYFYEKTQTRVTYEYIIFKDFQRQLGRRGGTFSVFLDRAQAKSTSSNTIRSTREVSRTRAATNCIGFRQYLEDKGAIVNVRTQQGQGRGRRMRSARAEASAESG